MKVILARHGNTFGPVDTPVWVGAREDYPLVEKGREQSTAIGAYLNRQSIMPDRIISGPLVRTREGADLIAAEIGFSGVIEIDERLKEIDYGSWGGKSDAEIEALYGADVIDDWRERTIIPDGADWSPDLATLRQNAVSVMHEITEVPAETVLLITSNGTLRYFHGAIYNGQDDAPSAKVKTGHICCADYVKGSYLPRFWNMKPDDI